MRKAILGSTMFAFIIIGAVVGSLVLYTSNTQEIIQSFGMRGWNAIVSAEGNPGAGASGVLDIMIYPHSANPVVDYATNLSNASSYAHYDTLNNALTGNVPYATTFDIVIKVRYNATHAYNTTGSKWMESWIKGLITCANLAIGADTVMSWKQVVNNTNYMWGNFYINNGGAGYTITHGQTVNVTSFKLQAYY